MKSRHHYLPSTTTEPPKLREEAFIHKTRLHVNDNEGSSKISFSFLKYRSKSVSKSVVHITWGEGDLTLEPPALNKKSSKSEEEDNSYKTTKRDLGTFEFQFHFQNLH